MMVSSVPVHRLPNRTDDEEDDEDEDVCRFCRSGNSPGRPLFHPCKCIGSIRYIHQECLVQWMKHSKKEFCELCKHPIKFQPIYAASMPHWLPLGTLVKGLVKTLVRAVKLWLHYSLVALCWLAFVPLISYRTYKCLFNRSLSPLISVPYEGIDVIMADCFKGSIIVLVSVCVILSLVWLRDQIVNGGGPEWLINNNNDDEDVNHIEEEVINDNNNAFFDTDDEEDRHVIPNDGDGLDAIINAIDLQVVDNAVQTEDLEERGNNNPAAHPAPAVVHPQDIQAPVQPIPQQPMPDIRDNLIDRAAEELTWERMLGMDGSLVFVEYVFWVATLNIVSITVFGLIPYHLGGVVTYFMGIDKHLDTSLIGRSFILLAGYVVVFIVLAHGHTIANYFNWPRGARVLGVGYIIVKVGLLLTTEVVIFPTLSGWWIDICSLSMFDSTLKDRINSLYTAPGTTIFLHWLVGMVFVFYFASFVLLLRRVLRPGVLWFLKNLNDPDFHPVQEMISYSMFKHVRRFCISCVVFGCSIMLIFLAPLKFIQKVFTAVIPYSVEMSTESILGEISLELLLLQVVLPQLLEQSNTKQWFKNCIEVWAIGVAKILVIPGYANNIDGLGTGASQTGPNAEIFVPFQPYYRPNRFKARVLSLVAITCFSMFIFFVFVLSVPVTLGRYILQFFMPAGQLHELYTFSCGLYTLWALTRISTMIYNWAIQGLAQFINKVKEWLLIITKCVYVAVTVCGLIPLLFGLLYEMILLLPLRVPLWNTPILLLWQDWGLGILFVKILYAATLTGPDWYLKRVLEQVFQAGVMQMDIKFVTNNLVLPIIVTQLHLLCVPYTICSVLPYLGFSEDFTHVCHRRIYPVSVVIFLSFLFLKFQLNQFKKLYEKIKNEKYLIGTRLVNFNGEESIPSAVSSNSDI